MKRRYVNRLCKTRQRRIRQVTFSYVEQYGKRMQTLVSEWAQFMKDMPEVVMTLQDYIRDTTHTLKYAIILLQCNQRIIAEERRKIPVGTFQRYKGSFEATHALTEMKENRGTIKQAMAMQRKLHRMVASGMPLDTVLEMGVVE